VSLSFHLLRNTIITILILQQSFNPVHKYFLFFPTRPTDLMDSVTILQLLFCFSYVILTSFILSSIRQSWNVSAFQSILNLCISSLIVISSANLGPYVSRT